MKSAEDSLEVETPKVNKYSVYKHTSPSGKVYVGITRTSLRKRWNNGKGYTNGSQPLFKKAILKYGWDSFIHEVVLSNISKSEAIYTEKYLIRWYKSHNMSYNITDGGETTSIKAHMKGTNNPMYGKHETNPMYGIRGSSNPNAIKVYQYTRDGIFIKEWGSIIEASKFLNISQNGISYCCKKKIPASGNFIWRYFYKENLGETAPAHIKCVYQYDINGKLVNQFSKIRDAIKFLGVPKNKAGTISSCCNGKYKSGFGYFWSFIRYDKYPIPDNLQIITKMRKQINKSKTTNNK